MGRTRERGGSEEGVGHADAHFAYDLVEVHLRQRQRPVTVRKILLS